MKQHEGTEKSRGKRVTERSWFQTLCQILVCALLIESSQPLYFGFATPAPKRFSPVATANQPAEFFDKPWADSWHYIKEGIATGLVTLSDFFVSPAHAQIITPSPNDLAETIDVRFTQAIQDQATALENDPVKIFNWVRNNIQVLPSYGSILGADLCLARKQCNPFDTASLLIALYRVSNIAAHYVEGTIRVPIALAQSWFGGATPADTLAVLTTGKIPATFVTDATNTVTAIQMDHIWVEGFVDYVPSRGEVEKQGDHFIKLDPSFKFSDTGGSIVAKEFPILLGTLPYEVIAVRQVWAELPGSLRPGAAPPTAEITGLAQLGNGQIGIQCNVVDNNLVSYKVEYSFQGSGVFIELASGTGNVCSGQIAVLDTTVLDNGLYDIKLTGIDSFGSSQSTIQTQEVTGELKLGRFTLAFDDIGLPVPGLPLVITRVYDSFNKDRGAFGVGWTIAINGIRLQEKLDRTVFLTLPRGKRVRFSFQLNPLNFFYSTAQWVSENGVTEKLRMVGSNQVLSDFYGGFPLSFVEDTTIPYACFEIPGYVLTLPSGVEITIQKPLLRNDIHTDPPCGKDYFGPVYGPPQVTKIQDPNGNTLTFTNLNITHSSGKSLQFQKDGAGRITQITDPEGQVLKYQYDGNGDLVSFTDQENNVTQYTYDAKHNMLDVIDPEGTRTNRTEYDAQGRMVALVGPDGSRVEFTHNLGQNEEIVRDTRGNITRLVYDGLGNVLLQEQPVTIEGQLVLAKTQFTVDARGNVTSIIDPDGIKTNITYDGQNNEIREVVDPGGLNLVTEYTYNLNGDVSSTTDPLGNVSQSFFDSKGNLTRMKDFSGQAFTVGYTPKGSPRSLTTPDGITLSSTVNTFGHVLERKRLDSSGNLMRRETFTYDQNGLVKSQTIYRTIAGVLTPITTTFEYDNKSRLTKTIDALGHETRLEYNNKGQLAARVDALGRRTTFEYDSFNDHVKTVFPDGTFETFAYDLLGNVIERKDRAGRVTTFEYDELNRLVKTNLPGGTSTQTVYTPGGQTAAQIDANGNRTEFVYDSAGRNTKIMFPEVVDADSGASVRPEVVLEYNARGNLIAFIDPKGRRTEYEYDAMSRRVKTIFPDASTQMVNYDVMGRILDQIGQDGKVKTFTYDSVGRLRSVILPPPQTGAPNPTTLFTYDEEGNLLTQTDALGRTTQLGYDKLGRLTKRILPMGQMETREYDAVGNVEKVVGFDGQILRLEYDVMNRLTKKIFDDGSEVIFTYTATGQRETVTDARGETEYAYDELGRLLSITPPDGSAVQYTYDDNGNRQTVTTQAGTIQYEYDAGNNLVKVLAPTYETRYAFDTAGNRKSIRHGNGFITRYQYDALDRLTEISHTASDGTLLESYGYQLNPSGLRTRVDEKDGTFVEYAYDGLDRLTREQRVGQQAYTIDYTYDPVGNRVGLNIDGTQVAYSYDQNDRMLTARNVTYQYDLNGNNIQAADGTRTVIFEYDFENRLKRVSDGIGEATYEYDTDGNRVKKTTAAGSIRYVVDPLNNTGVSQILEERGTQDELLAHYVYGEDLLTQTRGANTHHYHFDGQRSTRFLTAASGVTDSYTYDAFGNPVATTGQTENTYRYFGEQYDSDAGCYYLRERYYDSSVGRFKTSDPFPGIGIVPQSLHKYAYVHQNPINFRDPSGLAISTLSDLVQALVARYHLTLKQTSTVRTVCQFQGLADSIKTFIFVKQAMTAWVGALAWGAAFFNGRSLGSPNRFDLKFSTFWTLYNPDGKWIRKVSYQQGINSKGQYEATLGIDLNTGRDSSFPSTSPLSPNSLLKDATAGRLRIGYNFDLDKFKLDFGNNVTIFNIKKCGFEILKAEFTTRLNFGEIFKTSLEFSFLSLGKIQYPITDLKALLRKLGVF